MGRGGSILFGVYFGIFFYQYRHGDDDEVKDLRKAAQAEANEKRIEAQKKQQKLSDSNPKEIENSDQIQKADEEEDDEMSEEAIFIPLTFPRELPQTHYKGTDEAWQSFIALANDRQRIQSLRNDLAGHVGQHTSRIPGFQKVLGKDIHPRKYWLDIDFPDGPPTEYVRTGLEWADNYIYLATRPVDAHHVAQIKHTLWPKPMAISLWRSYNALWTAQLNNIRQLFNFSAAPIGEDTDGEGDDTYNELVEEPPSDNKTMPRTAGKLAGNSKPELPPGHPPISANQDSTKPDDLTPIQKILAEPGRVASEVFKRQMAKNWTPPNTPLMVYGSVLFSGLVELVGSKGFCVLDVHASYHPIEAKWVNISVAIRRTQPRKQAPKGDKPLKKE